MPMKQLTNSTIKIKPYHQMILYNCLANVHLGPFRLTPIARSGRLRPGSTSEFSLNMHICSSMKSITW